MRYYIVTEGENEALIFPAWIAQINSQLQRVYRIEDIKVNSYLVISGKGYPNFFKIIAAAIEDINNNKNIDRLVISIDSEEMTRIEKFEEVSDFLSRSPCSADICVVIQHFCLETWALGNIDIYRRKTTNPTIRDYVRFFDVTQQDPELLPPYGEDTRVKFAYKYLKALINDRYTGANYSKRRPEFLKTPSFFTQIVNRQSQTGHISSFRDFYDAFA